MNREHEAGRCILFRKFVMRNAFYVLATLFFVVLMESGLGQEIHAATLSIAIPRVGAPKACPLVMGTARNPQGDILSINRQCIEHNGKPWIPVAGEFHYVRYPRRDWLTELRKMKAGSPIP